MLLSLARADRLRLAASMSEDEVAEVLCAMNAAARQSFLAELRADDASLAECAVAAIWCVFGRTCKSA